MKVDARLKTWEAPDEQTVNAGANPRIRDADTAMLRRGFLGWLRGEPGHCSMAMVPTLTEEDAKRPHRERESLVQERTSTINRMKSILIQYGVRNFNPKLRKAAEKIDAVQTPEGVPLPSNAASALRRHMARFRLIRACR